jgi:recombination protein RecA
VLQQVEGKLYEKFGVRRGPQPVPAPEEPESEKKGRVKAVK